MVGAFDHHVMLKISQRVRQNTYRVPGFVLCSTTVCKFMYFANWYVEFIHKVLLDELLGFVHRIIILYLIIRNYKDVFLDNDGFSFCTVLSIHRFDSMAVQDSTV